jgi:hypothetical protein
VSLWDLYRRIADPLATEFEVAEAEADGVLLVDHDGTELWLTVKERAT